MKKYFMFLLITFVIISHFIVDVNFSKAEIHHVQVGPNFSFMFVPANVNAIVGDTILWTWISGTHNVVSTSVPQGASQFESILTNQIGYTFSYIVEVEGLYNYTCTPHTIYGMNGTINVMPSSVVNENSFIPDRFELRQNYPNPFNPVTKISFSVPANGNVTLSIYDVSGKEIALPVTGNYKAGNYLLSWDAGRFNSGVYFYKLIFTPALESSSHTSVRKMVYLK